MECKLLRAHLAERIRSRLLRHLWSEMLDDDAYEWFVAHGSLTRANGDRFCQMILSRDNTEDLAAMCRSAWLGAEPSVEPMLKYRGLSSR